MRFCRKFASSRCKCRGTKDRVELLPEATAVCLDLARQFPECKHLASYGSHVASLASSDTISFIIRALLLVMQVSVRLCTAIFSDIYFVQVPNGSRSEPVRTWFSSSYPGLNPNPNSKVGTLNWTEPEPELVVRSNGSEFEPGSELNPSHTIEDRSVG